MSDEGEDPSPRPKRKIKKVMVLASATESESDDSQPATASRNKRLRVLSEDGSDSSSGSWALGALRRRRALPGLPDSSGDSDSSDWASDGPAAPAPLSGEPGTTKSTQNMTAKAVSGFSSDSSEGNSEKCSICLMKFIQQEVGTPQNCEHIFCLDCITEWSKNMNTCPVDRISFESIVVRTCAGGRVLRTEPVQVLERRPSVETMLIEDPTICEICQRADHEESMLLCDGCDLGYHMQCLTPPLTRIPEDQWLCANCNGVWRSSPIFFPMQSAYGDAFGRSGYERARRESPARHQDEQPSTSSGQRGAPAPRALGGASGAGRRAPAACTRSRRTKRRTRTVIVEYEVQGNGKAPITRTKRVKTTSRKKRKTRRRVPRTAARRTHVMASVRAKLAAVRSERAAGAGAGAAGGSSELATRRAGAGIPSLSLFGSPHQLDYFAEDDEESGGPPTWGSATALASRPTPAVFSAYRQARRKLASIPSPAHAAAAPDLLGDILARQEALHSRHAVLSLTVDGDVNVTVQSTRRKDPPPNKKDSTVSPLDVSKESRGDALDDKKEVDLSKGGESRQRPAYPGQGRGWGGGYRYPREQNHHHANNHNNQGHQGYGRGGYDNGFGGGGRGAGGYGGAGGGPFDRRDEHHAGPLMDYNNRRPHYNEDEPWHERNRRPQMDHAMRGNNNNMPRNDQRRFSSGGGPAWQQGAGPRQEPSQRHSFGGFEGALDMRTAPPPRADADKPPSYAPLPEPPAFPLDAVPSAAPALPDHEEDERSDEGLIIDTEKYDPTSPTHDEDSPAASPPPPAPAPAPAALSPSLAAGVQSILASMEARGLGVPPAAVLDSAVRAALHEHRALLPSSPASLLPPGDCPNFSIYSATSVHIASDSSRGLTRSPPAPAPAPDPPEEPPTPPPAAAADPSPPPPPMDDYKAKLSKRCPITSNARDPIKIRLSGPALIRRPVALYDDEDVEQDAELEPAPALHAEVEPETIPTLHSDAEPKTTPMPQTEAEPEPEPTPEVQSDAEPELAPLIETDDGAQSETEDTRKISIDAERDEKQPDENENVFEEQPVEEPASAPDGDGTPRPRDEDEGDHTEEQTKDKSDSEASSGSPRSPHSAHSPRAPKMTESISETEDSRSYTPCLDERGLEPPERELEGLGTELISEEEAQDMFSEGSPPAPAPAPAPPEDGEILDKRRTDDTKKKKKKDGKKDKEGKGKGKKTRGDATFKKVARVKERSYRERDKDKEKRRSSSSVSRRRRKDKRKDLERYDVRTLVTERRRRGKDAFGRDVSPSRSPSAPRAASVDLSPRRARLSPSPRRARMSPSPRRIRPSPSPRRIRPSPSPRRIRPSPSPRRVRPSPSPRRARYSPSPVRRRASLSPPRRPRSSPSPRRARISPSPRRRASPSPRRARLASPSPRRASSAASPRRSPSPKRRRKRSGSRGAAARRRRSGSRARKRRRSPSPAASPKPVKQKKKKRSPRRRSQRRKRARRRSASAAPAPAASWSPPPPERAPSPRTPPPAEPVSLEERRRRRDLERAHRRLRDTTGPSKEVFTSGDNILVSVSFKESGGAGGIGRRARRAERRRRRRARASPPAAAAAKPVAIIDLERSPFRELTPSPKNVIVLSDDEAERAPAAAPPSAPAAAPATQQGPKTPPEPKDAAPQGPTDVQPPSGPAEGGELRGPLTPPEPPDSPDAYDPFEPTRSPSASPPAAPAAPDAAPAAAPPDPERLSMTLEAAQKTNLSADELLDRRPLSPIEKVMALLQSTRDVSPEEPEVRAAGASPGGGAPPAPAPPAPEPAALACVAPAPRVLLPDAPRSTPKLFLAKPSPIKSDPIKPMPQASKISRLPLPLPLVVGVRRASVSRSPSPPGGASPYSPGDSDFGDLFEPPPPPLAHRTNRRRNKNGKNKRTKRGSKTTVEVQLDDDSLKVMEELPSSAVEMQVKSKFLKKLNRQERVVEEVKLVLKPHYNKKHVSKDEYKHILRRAVPKICHNKTGEINPTKIQALVEAYVKKFRKKRKLGQ